MVYDCMMETQSKYKSFPPLHCSANTSNIVITLTIDISIYRWIGKLAIEPISEGNDNKSVCLCMGRMRRCLCGSSSRKANAHLEAMTYGPFMLDPKFCQSLASVRGFL